MQKLASMERPVPLIAADTEDELYVTQNLPGLWRLENVYWVPDTAVTANGTNYRVWTLARNRAATPTTWEDIGSLSTATTGDVIGTSRPITLSGDVELAQGEQVRFSKTDPGSGALAHGKFVGTWRKIN